MHNLAPPKSSYSKNPALADLMGFNIDKAKLICHLGVSPTFNFVEGFVGIVGDTPVFVRAIYFIT